MTHASKLGTLATLAALGLAAALPAAAQTSLFTSVGTQEGLAHQNGNLNIGPVITVSGLGVTVSQLGVFDYNDDGLAASHTVTLFSNAGGVNTALGSVTVPAGGAATASGYQYVALTAPLVLLPGSYSVIAYNLDGAGGGGAGNIDPYGEAAQSFNGGTNLTTSGVTFAFTTAASPSYPGGGTSPANLSSASFIYTNNVAAAPEPSQFAGLGLGVLGLAGLALKARKRSAA